MADYAPVYMDAYAMDQSEVQVLATITLSADEFEAGSAAGTVIGALGNKSTGGTLSVINDSRGNFAVAGSNLVVGPNGATLEEGEYSVTVLEVNQYATTTSRPTTFTVTATEEA